METGTPLPLVGIGVIVVMAGFGTIWCVVALQRRRTWAQTIGVIVGSELRVSTTSGSSWGSSRALVIEWRGADGAIRRYTESFSMTRLRVPVGKYVRLYVHPGDPGRATRALIAPGVMFGVAGTFIGTMFTLISLLATR